MFNKDLLLIDLEFTGIDPARHEIIQLAAVLLDKDTLQEKQNYSSYARPQRWENRDPEAMAVSNINWDQLKSAPDLPAVIKEFDQTFPKDAMLSNYGGILDTIFLQVAYKSAGLQWQFDYHILNLWPLCYLFMAKQKLLTNAEKFTGFELEDVLQHLQIPIKNRHDALSDCQIEAEVLRNIVKRIKFR